MSCSRVSAAFVLSILVGSSALSACGTSNRGSSTGGTSSGGHSNGGSAQGGNSSGGGGTSQGGGGAGGTAPVCPTIDYSTCPAATGTTATALVYDGATTTGTCASSIASPRVGTWFKYNDGTTGSTQSGATELNGRGGANDCDYHSTGMGFNNWGAGFGFSVNNLGGTLDCPEDDSGYTGLHLYVKGSADATRISPGYKSAPNTLHVKFITSKCRDNDDYGGWCSITPDWTLCDVPFASVIREGFKDSEFPTASDTFDPQELTKIQIQLDKFGTATDPPVNYEVWIDDISFY